MTDIALETRGLVKRYGGLVVTNDVSLSLRRGARHALIGPNGAGKTTLVGLLSGTIAPNAGTVSLFGRDVTRAAPAARTKLGLVRTFQITSLFPGLTVLENLYLAVNERRGESLNLWRTAIGRTQTLAEAERILGEFRLTAFANKRVSLLAYGQRRLVEIAIAIALEPKVLLLDEPAAGIPSGETRLLLDALDRLSPDIAILMIEHDMSLVRQFAKDATLLVQGAVAAAGTVNEVLNSNIVKEVYLGAAAAKASGARLHA
jgi:ABC-type branched-subunit amino acid transport system ATPase component